jgi:hypothetical protein
MRTAPRSVSPDGLVRRAEQERVSALARGTTQTLGEVPAAGIVAAALLLLLEAVAGNPARAEIMVAPVVQEVTLDSASASQGSWRVKNLSSARITVSVRVNGYRDYIRGHRNAPGPPWLEVSPAEVYLGPGEETSVAFRAILPDGLEGEEIAMVFFQEGGSAMIQGRIGTAFYVMGRGTLRPEISLEQIRVVDDGRGGNRFFLQLVNPGNVHLRPSGTLELVDSGGTTVASARLPEGMPVLPNGRERYVSESLDRVPPPGDYQARWTIQSGRIENMPAPVLRGETSVRIESR